MNASRCNPTARSVNARIFAQQECELRERVAGGGLVLVLRDQQVKRPGARR
jgi:hypothetical protein